MTTSDTPVFRHGQFVWREIMTSSVDDSLRFYGEVVGWKHETAKMPDGERSADQRPGVGEFCWEQLDTTDPKGAHPFYAAVFGWTDKPFSGGGDMNVWSAGDVQVASRMQAPAGHATAVAHLRRGDTLEAANRRVGKHGGTVLMPKIDIPTVGSISVVQDNVGAVIGLFEAPR